jgi:hypothetical protein
MTPVGQIRPTDVISNITCSITDNDDDVRWPILSSGISRVRLRVTGSITDDMVEY